MILKVRCFAGNSKGLLTERHRMLINLTRVAERADDGHAAKLMVLRHITHVCSQPEVE